MFTRTLSMYSIINFNKQDYSKVINNIEESRGYISFIDSQKNKGHINKRYEKYLNMKQALYTARGPHRSEGSLYTYVLPNDITESKVNDLYKKYGVQDDYYVNKTLISDFDGVQTFGYEAIPIENEVFKKSLNMDEHLEKVNHTCLSKNFIMNNHRRFLLLPFLTKYKGHYVEPIIIANVYDIGIITVQLILSFEHDKVISLSNDTPRSILLDEILFYPTKENYKINDFWSKEIKKNVSVDSIMEFYENQLAILSKVEMFYNPTNRPVSWVFADLELNRNPNHEDFVNKNKRIYASHLTNGNKEAIERRDDDYIGELLKESTIMKTKGIYYYCTPSSSVVTIGYEALFQNAKDSLAKLEKDLKSAGIYEEHLRTVFREQILMIIPEFLRFYELTFIKRYFLIKLLDEISQGNYKTIRDYNSIKRDLNFIKLQYDEEVLFFTEGSPKELYKSILEKSNVNNLLTKAEGLIKDIRDDVTNFRDLEIKQNETLILILTSLLTILLGYNGIRLIVNDFLANLPFLGPFISKHPLRYTITLWGILIAVMVSLNVRRWKINKK
ncbi:hypothetical protein KXS12_24250 [Priestia filamentosa]|uniref:hypothetical protein n=1 Tax=Priestia filamentosa TaxID=1402861 RepID=UPI003F1446F5